MDHTESKTLHLNQGALTLRTLEMVCAILNRHGECHITGAPDNNSIADLCIGFAAAVDGIRNDEEAMKVLGADMANQGVRDMK